MKNTNKNLTTFKVSKKNPAQLELPLAQAPKHGGARKGAGRPNRKGEGAHCAREAHNPKYPVHVSVRLNSGMPGLRTKPLFQAFKRAVLRARLKGLRVVEYSLQGNHFHLIVEANTTLEVSRGMQSFNVTMAMALARLIRQSSHVSKRLRVLARRYHAHVLKNPSELKRALKYVLFNRTKHRMETRPREIYTLDYYSSAVGFARLDWLLGAGYKQYDPPKEIATRWWQEIGQALASPTSWLLRIGWARGVA